MNINWLVRIKNINFWLAIVPAVLLLAQVCAAPFGYRWDFTVLNQQLAAIINAAFAVLAILGIVTDMTTKGLSDSAQAMAYSAPRDDTAATVTTAATAGAAATTDTTADGKEA